MAAIVAWLIGSGRAAICHKLLSAHAVRQHPVMVARDDPASARSKREGTMAWTRQTAAPTSMAGERQCVKEWAEVAFADGGGMSRLLR